MTTASKLQFEKDRTAIKFYLLGRSYTTALKAMAFAEEYHTGTRKDGVTPEFHHQLRIAFNVTTLRDVVNEESCITLAFTHDVDEDYHVGYQALEKVVGAELAKKTCLLNKSQHDSEDSCFRALSADRECSIVKGADNIDNVQTMAGVFTFEKIQSYLARSETSVLPMLKRAQRLFPEQTLAYASLRATLKRQLNLFSAIYQASQQSSKG